MHDPSTDGTDRKSSSWPEKQESYCTSYSRTFCVRPGMGSVHCGVKMFEVVSRTLGQEQHFYAKTLTRGTISEGSINSSHQNHLLPSRSYFSSPHRRVRSGRRNVTSHHEPRQSDPVSYHIGQCLIQLYQSLWLCICPKCPFQHSKAVNPHASRTLLLHRAFSSHRGWDLVSTHLPRTSC